MISIIMLCHNQVESTKRTVKSLLKFQNDVKYRMIIVDNGSTDATSEYIKTIPGDVSIIQYNENKGFIEPNNTAMKMTDDDVLFLNNDIEVFFDHWLDRLHEELQSSDVGLTYPLVQTRGQLFYGGIIENKKESLLNYVNDCKKTFDDKKKLKTPTWAQFCCALVKRSVIDDIGLLDGETYKIGYYEDVDYCVRLTEKYKMKLVEDVIVEHFQSVTTKAFNLDKYRSENRNKFYKKWEGKF
jgi:GT2 family glycosyltransferase